MRLLTSLAIFAGTISALPITSDISTFATTDSTDSTGVPANIATAADSTDRPYGYGPPPGPYNYGPPPPAYGNGGGRGYGNGNRGQGPSVIGGLDNIAYGIGELIGAPVGALGGLVGGIGNGIYNGIRGPYKLMKKGAEIASVKKFA
jgi:hypothetical protein